MVTGLNGVFGQHVVTRAAHLQGQDPVHVITQYHQMEVLIVQERLLIQLHVYQLGHVHHLVGPILYHTIYTSLIFLNLVNGAWSEWTNGTCSVSCGPGGLFDR